MLFDIPDPKDSRARGLPFSRVGPLGLVLFLVVVVLAFFMIGGATNDDGSKEPADTPVGEDTFVREPKFEILDDGEVAAQYPETVRDELQSELFEWWQEPGRTITDNRDELESGWVRHLLSDDVRPRLERLPGWVFGDVAPTQKVLDEPGPFRGRLVQVWGSVGAVDEVPLPDDPVRRGWRVRIDDSTGRAWTVVTVLEPPADVKPGTWTKAFGVFVKLRPAEDGRATFLVFSAQKLLPSYPPVEHREIDPEWAEEVRDETLETSQRRPGDEPAFWNLMNYVRSLGQDEIRRRIDSGEIPITDMTSARGATDLAQKPALHRFSAVRLRVGLAKDEGAFLTEPDLAENVGNIRSVFRGFVIDDQQRVMWVLSPFPAEAFPISGARLAIVEGFFYKRIAVEKRSGTGHYWMPVLIGTSVRPIDTSKAPSHAAEQAAWIVVIGAVVCAVLLVWLMFRNRRLDSEVRRRQEDRLGRRATRPASPEPPVR